MPLAIIVIYLIKGACTYSQSVIMSFIGLRIVNHLRNRLYEQMQKQSPAFFAQHPNGILMSRITNDVGLIRNAVSDTVTSLMRDVFTLICLVFVVFYRDWQLALIAMLVFPLDHLSDYEIRAKMRKVATSTQISMGSLTTILQETISGARIVKAFCDGKYENEKFAAKMSGSSNLT